MTLLELLVVLAIVALAAVVVAPSMGAGGKGAERRALRLRVIAMVRDAQNESTRRGVPIAAVFEPATGRLSAGEKGGVTLPRGWRVEVEGRALEAPREGAGGAGTARELFTWSPGGLASSGAWRLTDGKGATIEVECDAIDGVRVK